MRKRESNIRYALIAALDPLTRSSLTGLRHRIDQEGEMFQKTLVPNSESTIGASVCLRARSPRSASALRNAAIPIIFGLKAVKASRLRPNAILSHLPTASYFLTNGQSCQSTAVHHCFACPFSFKDAPRTASWPLLFSTGEPNCRSRRMTPIPSCCWRININSSHSFPAVLPCFQLYSTASYYTLKLLSPIQHDDSASSSVALPLCSIRGPFPKIKPTIQADGHLRR